jgi:hypothetical protein
MRMMVPLAPLSTSMNRASRRSPNGVRPLELELETSHGPAA